MIRDIVVKSALHYHETEMPCNWDVNVYRGCGHGCRYCFAQYSHDYIGGGNFFGEIYAKVNVAERLDRELSRRTWRHPRINLSGVCDAYQPVEASKKLMPDVWKVLIRHRNPVIISTKSSLILRDIDLIAELARVTSVCVGASITILDEDLRKVMEPAASPALERFRVLDECRRSGCKVQVLMMPLMPMLNDSPENLENIYVLSRKAGVTGLSGWPLHLRGNTKQRFFSFLEAEFPDLLPQYRRLYWKGSKVDPVYHDRILRIKEGLRKKYGIPGLSVPITGNQDQFSQLSLF